MLKVLWRYGPRIAWRVLTYRRASKLMMRYLDLKENETAQIVEIDDGGITYHFSATRNPT